MPGEGEAPGERTSTLYFLSYLTLPLMLSDKGVAPLERLGL
ncbi:hypothetical protein NXV14_05760 [Bacteroides fragilis]|nr:hypothetical protein [Bacteroides fragilis]